MNEVDPLCVRLYIFSMTVTFMPIFNQVMELNLRKLQLKKNMNKFACDNWKEIFNELHQCSIENKFIYEFHQCMAVTSMPFKLCMELTTVPRSVGLVREVAIEKTLMNLTPLQLYRLINTLRDVPWP